jgi:regulatory protein
VEEPLRKKYSPEYARQKIEAYCAYQERSHYEVKEKLYSFGLNSTDVNAILSGLIADNFLNEERFALAIASGKFRIKGWGKAKIKMALKQKRVSDYCIKVALKSIPDDEYFTTLLKVAARKNKDIKEKDEYKRKYKLTAYLMSRGFERDLIQEAIQQILDHEAS